MGKAAGLRGCAWSGLEVVVDYLNITEDKSSENRVHASEQG